MKQLFLFLFIIYSCSTTQLDTQVFKDNNSGVTFRYPNNWVKQNKQSDATLILLYEQNGSEATCNLSVIKSDKSSIEKLNSKYFSTLLSKIYSNVSIDDYSKKEIGGNLFSIIEASFDLHLPSKTIKAKSLISATIQDGMRYLLILNVPSKNVDIIRSDFNIIAGTMMFHKK